MSEIKSTLNYLSLNAFQYWKGEFLGFADMVKDTCIGFDITEDTCIVPLLLFFYEGGWGAGEPTSSKFPWVVYAKGIDDANCYMLFGEKNAALKFAKEYINGDKVLNPWEDTYKNRKWQWQN